MSEPSVVPLGEPPSDPEIAAGDAASDAAGEADGGDEVRRGRGRPPDMAKRDAILDATREVLAEVGYASLTIDAVAKRAGASRMLLYRAWESKLTLVSDAIMGSAERLVLPDTGTLVGDLRDFVAQHVEHMRVPAYLKGVPGLTVELLNDPAATREIWRRYVEPSDLGFAEIFRRARDRGELRTHPEPAVVTRAVSGITTGLGQTTRMSGEQITDMVLAALLGGMLETG